MDPKLTWRSENYNSMSITLVAATETIMIANAYLPTYIDGMTWEEKEGPIKQHMEIYERAKGHDHAILMMDANETTSTNGRVHVSYDAM